jgi:hypothetical protein
MMPRCAACLLARTQDSFQVWGRFDHQGPASEIEPLLVLCSGMILLATVVAIWYRLTRHSTNAFEANSPPRLFRELCRAHRLSRPHRRLLKHLAAARGLSSPASLFVRPECFDLDQLPSEVKLYADELNKLRAQLFRRN